MSEHAAIMKMLLINNVLLKTLLARMSGQQVVDAALAEAKRAWDEAEAQGGVKP